MGTSAEERVEAIIGGSLVNIQAEGTRYSVQNLITAGKRVVADLQARIPDVERRRV